MITSSILKKLQPYFDVIDANKGKTFGEISRGINNGKHLHFKKGASGLILENLLGLENNNSKKADLEELGVEIKVLPIQMSTGKAKEPTQIKMINYMKVATETWEDAEIRHKIKLILWVVYGVEKEDGMNVSQDKYVLLDWFLDSPDTLTQSIFKKDWEEIKGYIVNGKADKLSCSMGVYIEPKTKGANNKDKTMAPDGFGGTIMARRRAFYFKKNYTNNKIIANLSIEKLNNRRQEKQ